VVTLFFGATYIILNRLADSFSRNSNPRLKGEA